MKGVVFNLLEEVVSRQHGDATWDELLEHAGLDGAYTSLGSYADEDMVRLLDAASSLLGQPPRAVLRWFGQQAMSVLSERYPAFFTRCSSSRPFVLSVNSIIHPEVRKLYTGANCPTFQFQDGEDGALLMTYRSPRKLCAMAQGFVEGAAAHYGERVTFDHLECMHEGDAQCRFRITWPSMTGP